MNIELTGRSIIGKNRGSRAGTTFHAYDPRTGGTIEPAFYSAAPDELARAAELAALARGSFGNLSGRQRALFLRAIAGNIEDLGDTLIERASLETGLPHARFAGERARTCGQLRMFADLLDEGSWVGARIDHAIADREPVPKPDVRSMLRPQGPVAVFCASNFPLAY
jgi:NADP-dependent aldehyde dehydrogenase